MSENDMAREQARQWSRQLGELAARAPTTTNQQGAGPPGNSATSKMRASEFIMDV
jgi:hypothetical protein